MDDFDSVKALLNLHAVLKNLEDLVEYDPEAAKLVRDRSISIEFDVRHGPRAHVVFERGRCTVGQGGMRNPTIRLGFVSPRHLNSMFDDKGFPIPFWGLHRIRFVAREFTQLTKRLEHFLKPSEEKLLDTGWLALNTRMTMTTAAFASAILGNHDHQAHLSASTIRDGTICLAIGASGPAVSVTFDKGVLSAQKGMVARPSVTMRFKDLATANGVLNNRLDPLVAIVKGDVEVRGQLGMLETFNLTLDRIPAYLS